MTNKRTDYNQKEVAELAKILGDKEKELLDTKVSIAQRKTKDIHLPGKIRREIARVKSALRNKN
ncbi:MAG: 50S ribosomal protein L29 [Candidatus Woykebacteria bacterium RBG_16_44_10]|uniref:Large ribosomal subunit protein uL29 n=1 Tax=Candidatus Woykebacteria bacterium RBG_16_44_10 TaxID=1802597 RepID=A0A1G1WE74_9BACT|nr:MAG: 50S ribosomal protein L29 [Candidatus Woykebacteria bacterium RBG_16_44_10]